MLVHWQTRVCTCLCRNYGYGRVTELSNITICIWPLSWVSCHQGPILQKFYQVMIKTFWQFIRFNYTPAQWSCWGVYWFHSVRPSVRLSVRPSRMRCPLCNIYSAGWILSILGTNGHYHERVCRAPWPLTLTYIFKVIRPWLKKSCPLCSIYSSGWIFFIFGTNDHYC